MFMINKQIEGKLLRSVTYGAIKSIYKAAESFGVRIYDTRLKNHKPRKIVSDRFEFIYIEAPIAASQSIIGLIESSDRCTPKPYSTRDWSNIPSDDIRDYTKFTVKRNPWTRLVSCYNKKVLNACSIARMGILAQYEGVEPQMEFSNFVDWICSDRGRGVEANKHWVSQHVILMDINPVKPDVILELNNLNKALINLFSRFGMITEEVHHRGKSSDQLFEPKFDKKKKYYSTISSEKIYKLEQIYQEDCEIFEYKQLSEWLNE